MESQVHSYNLIDSKRCNIVQTRVDQFSASSECEIEISTSVSQDECTEQRGIDESAGVWGYRRVHRPPPTPTGRGAICTFQVHTKAMRGGRSKL